MKRILNAPPRHLLIAILALSVVLRLAVAVYMGNTIESLPGINDQITYHTLALRILGGHGFSFGQEWWPATQPNAPTAHWSFLYTFYLAAVYGIFGAHPLIARLIQVLIVGILHPLLAYAIGKTVFNQKAGLAAALFTAVYIYFIYYAAALLTEPFFLTLALVILYQLIAISEKICCQEHIPFKQIARDGISLGLMIAAAAFLRQLILLVVPFLSAWLLWSVRRQWKPALKSLTVAALVVILAIMPITIFNYARFGRFVLLNTNSGFAFYWANHPIYGTQFESIITNNAVNYRDLLPKDLNYRKMNEAEVDQEMLRRGLQFVIDDPVRYALLSLNRIQTYFVFWPSADSSLVSNLSRVFSFGIFLPFMLYGMYRTLRRFRGDWLATPAAMLLLFCALYTAIHLLTWTLIRYRLPIDSVGLTFAGFSVAHLTRKVW